MDILLKSPSVHMKHPEKVHMKLEKIVKDGVDKLLFISDFDHTLSKSTDTDGNRVATTPQVIRELVLEKHPELEKIYTEIVAKYIGIETCPFMTAEEKVPHMIEWYTKTQNYAINAGLSKQDIKRKVDQTNLENAIDYMKKIGENNIPHIVFSAGMGEVIEFLFEKELNETPKNLHIVSNLMIFDEKDICTAFSKPIIHTFNKNSTVIKEDHSFVPEIFGRVNVILIGDSLGDPHMDVGIQEESTALKFGFLNTNFDTHMEKYLELYDVVLKDDQTMSIPLKIFEYILSSNK